MFRLAEFGFQEERAGRTDRFGQIGRDGLARPPDAEDDDYDPVKVRHEPMNGHQRGHSVRVAADQSIAPPVNAIDSPYRLSFLLQLIQEW